MKRLTKILASLCMSISLLVIPVQAFAASGSAKTWQMKFFQSQPTLRKSLYLKKKWWTIFCVVEQLQRPI